MKLSPARLPGLLYSAVWRSRLRVEVLLVSLLPDHKYLLVLLLSIYSLWCGIMANTCLAVWQSVCGGTKKWYFNVTFADAVCRPKLVLAAQTAIAATSTVAAAVYAVSTRTAKLIQLVCSFDDPVSCLHDTARLITLLAAWIVVSRPRVSFVHLAMCLCRFWKMICHALLLPLTPASCACSFVLCCMKIDSGSAGIVGLLEVWS